MRPEPSREDPSHGPPAVLVAGGFALLVLALRSVTFFHSVENWDESLYLLMARSMLDGHTLYTEIWDHKPPGIFVLFALAQLAFGRSVLAIRIAAWLAVTASATILFLIGRRLRSPLTGLVAGVLYATYALNDGGLASNVEIFFTPFVLALLHRVVAATARELLDRPGRALAIGLLAGIAIQLKYVVVFDFAAFALALAPALLREARLDRPGRLTRFVAAAAAGALAPFLLCAAIFAASGHFADYADANFAANARYVGEVGIDVPKLAFMIVRRVREAFPLWLSVALAPFVLAMRRLEADTRRGIVIALVWAAFAFLGLLAMRRMFAHYFLGLTAPLCLLAALVVCAAVESGDRTRAETALLLALVLLGPVLRSVEKPVSTGVRTFFHRVVRHEPLWGDEPAQVAAYLGPRVGAQDYLYVADYQPILYYLLPVRIPTRFVLPPHLAAEKWHDLTGFDPEGELRAIFAKRPAFVIEAGDGDTPFYRILHEELARGYELDHTIGTVRIYRRAGDSPAAGAGPAASAVE